MTDGALLSPSTAPAIEAVTLRLLESIADCAWKLHRTNAPQSIRVTYTTTHCTSNSRTVEQRNSVLCFPPGTRKKRESWKFGAVCKTLSLVYSAVCDGRHFTKRDLYYLDPALFRNQHQSNGIIDVVCAVLGTDRTKLNLIASARGLIQSNTLSWTLHNTVHTCREATTITPFVHQITAMNGILDFILVVEKETVFQHLTSHGFIQLYRCALLTGKGFPCLATRQMLHALSNHFPAAPVLALVDADVSGLEIFAVYKYGAARMCREYAVPRMQCIGVFLSDLHACGALQRCAMAMTSRERKRIEIIREREWIARDDPLRNELNCMKEWQCKAEIEGLLQTEPSFIERYLPAKLAATLQAASTSIADNSGY